MTDPLLDSLRRALDADPSDVALRLHLAQLLSDRDDPWGAVAVLAAGLTTAPDDPGLRQAMLSHLGPDTTRGADATRGVDPTPDPLTPPGHDGVAPAPHADFDWSAAESQVSDLTDPMFVDSTGAAADHGFDVRREHLSLADVGGMQEVTERLTAAFLAPLQNPDLRRLYGKSLRGALLLYGPPGCGKTFLARALADELQANFMPIGPAELLGPHVGNGGRTLHEAFQLARRAAPCVLFFDEIEVLAPRRTQTGDSGPRGAVDQLLTELDGISGVSEGVFVLGATSRPWELDPAMRRPGRFDRMVLVPPPDQAAREAIFRHHLTERPVEGIELVRLAEAGKGLSGADIAYACELGAERARLDGVQSGQARMISMNDLQWALEQVIPSPASWFDSARHVVASGNADGSYNELKAFLKKAKRL